MSNGGAPSFGGDNVVHGDQSFGDLDKSKGKQEINVEGDMHGSVAQENNFGEVDPWQELLDAVGVEVDEQDRAAVLAKINELKEEVEKPEPDEGAIKSLSNAIKPYKGLISVGLKVAKEVAKTFPGGGIAVAVLESAIQVAK